MFDILEDSIKKLAASLTERGLTCATAESCTGGLIGAALTSVSGSSAWFRGGVIAYDNSVKEHMLGVTEHVLRTHGAVSHPTVRQMALGACTAAGTAMAVAVSGVAGPDGGTELKPVGTVYIGLALRGLVLSWRCHFPGNRDAVRQAAVQESIRRMQAALDILPCGAL